MILDDLAAYARLRVARDKEKIPLDIIKKSAEKMNHGDFCFEQALKKQGLSFICEVKRASPSKGIIDEKFDYLQIASDYQNIGADCVSCLTEPKWFLGSDEIFCDIRKKINLPMIRKDFTVDKYQLYQAKCMGADAVLLICAILDTGTIKEYLEICDNLGLSALVETHNEKEIESAVTAGARIIGVNNRNLGDFSVDIKNAERLRSLVPKTAVFVAESGVKTAEDVKAVYQSGADAVLIGEAMMKSDNKRELLQSFKRVNNE